MDEQQIIKHMVIHANCLWALYIACLGKNINMMRPYDLSLLKDAEEEDKYEGKKEKNKPVGGKIKEKDRVNKNNKVRKINKMDKKRRRTGK